MKILFTGGGSGGHFYPIIAVAQELEQLVQEKRLLDIEMYYMASTPFDERMLFEYSLIFKKVPTGKIRRYASILNVLDIFKTAIGVLEAIWQVFLIFPDVVFGKGGYDSFPALLAARIFKIPVVIHESDSVPGKVNKWAGKFAKRVAITFPEAAEFFPGKDVAYTGNPIRRELFILQKSGAHEFLNLEKNIPVIMILGGSQGAKIINDRILDALPDLVEKYQIIHQVGEKNLKEVMELSSVILDKNIHKSRYRPFGYLNSSALKMSAGAAELIISRAGAGTISEIALWGIPSILIPISETVSHDQYHNAFAYARTGAAIVIEEKNLTTNILASQIDHLMNNPRERERMREATKKFARSDAARVIAKELLSIALEHEK
jgi:UDP-N-acetylglucosamine--N-acetylmuramyl-(pentapeptide) pyrophosphoryl-undecaprenol N-acetylglucosamine transferase